MKRPKEGNRVSGFVALRCWVGLVPELCGSHDVEWTALGAQRCRSVTIQAEFREQSVLHLMPS